MKTIVISPVKEGRESFRAVFDNREFVGKTAGAVLDDVTAHLETGNNGFVVFPRWQPDEFFTAQQQQRLSKLMRKLHAEDDNLSEAERQELEELVEAELIGSGKRAAKIAQELSQ